MVVLLQVLGAVVCTLGRRDPTANILHWQRGAGPDLLKALSVFLSLL